MEEKRQSLGTSIIPTNYKIFIEPNFTTFKYTGEETISIFINSSTKTIRLNSADIEILSAEIISDSKVQKCTFKENKEEETITFFVKDEISGDAKLKLSFKGYHNDQMVGFYRSKYTYDGKEQYFMTTQFEAVDARRAFPCFDEPILKATFELSLLVDAKHMAISNMPIISEDNKENKKLVTFKKTLKMSSYLLYIGVGALEATNDKLGKLNLRLISIPGNKAYAKLPLLYAKKFITFFEKYFGIKYPLEKLDLIAVPDFAAGAMENWGAITFRENALLLEDTASIQNRKNVAETIAHELAHQWFGDLVTMKWWNDLWLNESFATFMSNKALNNIFPEWEIKLDYFRETLAVALSADQLLSTHSINVEVNSPSKINEIFDEITYQKGGSVLNMIENYVGYEIFRKGLHTYLINHSYSNATKEDLWSAINNESKKQKKNFNVDLVAKAWIEKKGYPYIKISKQKGKFILSQQRFTILNEKSNELWPIPVNYFFNHNSKKTATFLMDKKTVEIKSPAENSILKLNAGEHGIYRVFYGAEFINELGEMIKEQELSPEDSWSIEDDLYYFMKKGMYSIDDYLNFVTNYCFAAKYPLNLNVMSHLNGLYFFFYNVKSEKKNEIKQLLKEYSNEVLKQVGWSRSNKESTIITSMRSASIANSGLMGDKSTINKAKKMFNNYINNGKNIDPNIKSAVYEIVAFYGNMTTFSTFLKKYQEEKIPIEKSRYIQSLAFFNNKQLINKALNFSLSQKVRPQDSFIIPAIASSNPLGSSIVFHWSFSNWKLLMQTYQKGTHMLGRYIDNFASITDKRLAIKFNSFFSNPKNRRDDIKMTF